MTQPALVPKHVGLILDGNRRWAKAHGLPPLEGHRQGFDNLWTIFEAALDEGITTMTAYMFSTENWKRSQEEVGYLMGLILKIVSRDVPKLQKYNMRLLWLGSKVGMDPKVRRAIEKAEELTKNNTRGLVGLCINHGGQREITEAVQRIVQDNVPANEISEATIAKYLDYPELPPIDLIIRTSGEQRLSNFMLWRAAYSELFFSKKFWPAFTPDDLRLALHEYARRQRRMGE